MGHENLKLYVAYQCWFRRNLNKPPQFKQQQLQAIAYAPVKLYFQNLSPTSSLFDSQLYFNYREKLYANDSTGQYLCKWSLHKQKIKVSSSTELEEKSEIKMCLRKILGVFFHSQSILD